ncbi:MAG: hypothetical protein J6S13_02680 [Clostridia bacterium]|nr:hypothetical protein [Clostridia bacterium]
MKSNIFVKIIDTEEVEVESTWQETVDRLRAQGGDDYYARIRCSRLGNIVAYNRYGQYYLKGEVVVEDKKTKVKIYTVRDRTAEFFSWVITAVDLLLLAIFVPLVYIKNNGLNLAEILIAVTMLLLGVYNVLRRFWLVKNTPQSVEPYKRLLIKMVKSVDLWFV